MDRCVRARIRRMCAASIKSTSTTKVRACAHSTRFRFIIWSRSMGRRDARVHSLGWCMSVSLGMVYVSLGLVHVCLSRVGVCLSRQHHHSLRLTALISLTNITHWSYCMSVTAKALCRIPRALASPSRVGVCPSPGAARWID